LQSSGFAQDGVQKRGQRPAAVDGRREKRFCGRSGDRREHVAGGSEFRGDIKAAFAFGHGKQEVQEMGLAGAGRAHKRLQSCRFTRLAGLCLLEFVGKGLTDFWVKQGDVVAVASWQCATLSDQLKSTSLKSCRAAFWSIYPKVMVYHLSRVRCSRAVFLRFDVLADGGSSRVLKFHKLVSYGMPTNGEF
jgi:hypothetical protein